MCARAPLSCQYVPARGRKRTACVCVFVCVNVRAHTCVMSVCARTDAREKSNIDSSNIDCLSSHHDFCFFYLDEHCHMVVED